MATEQDAAETKRGHDADIVVKEADKMSSRWTNAQADISKLLDSVGTFAAAMPSDVQAYISTVDAAACEIGNICDGTREATQEIIAQSTACVSEVKTRRGAFS